MQEEDEDAICPPVVNVWVTQSLLTGGGDGILWGSWEGSGGGRM